MGNVFYTVIIYPLIQIIEFVFKFGWKIFESPGIQILCVSFAVSLLTLPLYAIAEYWQEAERKIEKRLAPKIKDIKAVFHGNEQYMILSTYYRQQHYHPIMALRSSFGLLVQIPFFTAAYCCLSGMSALKGVSFFFIRDLGAPDATFTIGNFTVNILPIVMTLINCVSGMIYTKSLKLRDKVQVFGLAFVFLCILYNSPAGLVLYWTMNNVFGLVKNIFYKLKHPIWVLYGIMCALVTALILYVLFGHVISMKRAVLTSCVFALVYFAPLFVRCCNFLTDRVLCKLLDSFKLRLYVFLAAAAGVWLLAGFLVPTFVIASSPMEFSGIEGYGSPLFFVKNTLLQAFGLYVVWPSLVYFLYGKKLQSLIAAFYSIFFACSLVNAFLFPGNYDTLSTLLIFKTSYNIDSGLVVILFNIAVLVAVAAAVLLSLKKIPKMAQTALAVAAVSVFCVAVSNVFKISKGYEQYKNVSSTTEAPADGVKPILHLSKTGRNVLLMFLDKAQNRFLEPIFDEYPRLYEEFSGFTLYKNTVSYSGWTLLGASPCYGGYDYTPEAKSKRDDVPLVEKQNEALLMLPRIFTEQATDGEYSATVTDPSWANFSWIPDLSIYKDYPKISAYLTDGVYSDQWYREHKEVARIDITGDVLKRNLLWYGLFKVAPVALRPAIYNSGSYWNPADDDSDMDYFLKGYSVLEYLPRLTDFDSKTENTFTYFVNNTSHDSAFLQYPDYVPVSNFTQKSPSEFKDDGEWYSNAGTLHRVGEFFQYLKDNGVYDNTRIIIVADHGSVGKEEEYEWDSKFDQIQPGHFHPLLMMKDFGEQGKLKVNYDFMTNADVPAMAVRGIIDNAVNPFTGVKVDSSAKKDGALVCTRHFFMPYQVKSKYKYDLSESYWWRVKDNIFKSENWTHEVQGKVE